MKKLIITLNILLLAVSSDCFAMNGRMEELWDEANNCYINGDYTGAIERYESILDNGYAGSKLYYNLGNAHFKSNNIGQAIVNYNRAQRLAPTDKDIEYNLSVANSYVKDKIEVIPGFFINNWMSSTRSLLTSNAWAVLSLVLLAAALSLVLVYVLAEKKSTRKAGFFSAIVCFVFFVATVSFAAAEKRKVVNASEAIITASSVSVKSSPDKASKDIFILHEGTKVSVESELDTWREIMIPDGNKGWVSRDAIEFID